MTLLGERENVQSRFSYPTVTVLFSDIESSSAMTERLGDFAMHHVMVGHTALVRAEVSGCGGILAGDRGDGFMAVFADARRAVQCAIDMQRSVRNTNARHPGTALRVRIGLHQGPAIRDGDEFFGRTICAAARITALAQGNEILISGAVLTEAGNEFLTRSRGNVRLRGLSDVHVLHRVFWYEERAPLRVIA
jgi:class 3 adenylate cyclase